MPMSAVRVEVRVVHAPILLFGCFGAHGFLARLTECWLLKCELLAHGLAAPHGFYFPTF